MTAIAMVAAFFVLLIGWSYVQHRRSRRPLWNPLWTAFTLTAVSLLYGIGGLLGYDVPRHNPFIDHPPVWVGHIVWSQVSWALVALLASLFFWWLGLRRLSQS
ncbi:MAG TPA: hypothetical protein VMF13_20780 [Luteitalea sp.]|nr:hypothetical protein [Luteitalea sp.]